MNLVLEVSSVSHFDAKCLDSVNQEILALGRFSDVAHWASGDEHEQRHPGRQSLRLEICSSHDQPIGWTESEEFL